MSFRFSAGRAALAAWLAAAALSLCAAAAAPEEMEPLKLKLPRPVFEGTPKDTPAGTTVEKPSNQPRAPIMVPKGVRNVALNKKVTSSKPPFSGELSLVTDGDKEATYAACLELRPRLQWIQIDLGEPHKIWAIAVWHFHMTPIVVHDVIVQVSNDPDFTKDVTTLFNNDQDNSAGLGIGKDREYFETYEGKLIEGKGVTARYVRLYSDGSTYTDKLNRYTEVEVYGTPAK
ncbi:MAG: discoidin domain-containing protein [Armatimonadota bacterium]|nr:discoidin domain-containing protein [Armatimonadota bacterium]